MNVSKICDKIIICQDQKLIAQDYKFRDHYGHYYPSSRYNECVPNLVPVHLLGVEMFHRLSENLDLLEVPDVRSEDHQGH